MNRRYGNAQTIGDNVTQNTYFMTKQKGDGFLAVLADGTIDSVTGAYAAILACETIAKGFVSLEDADRQLELQFARTAALLNERLYKGRQPRVSALAACFLGNRMFYRNVGDLSLVSYDGRELVIKEEGAGQLDVKGVTTLLCSQGVRQALEEIDIEKLLSGRRHPYEKAQNIIEAVNRRNLKNQRSALAVIVA
jgi:serine/threonine protein phosphatase PrpC